MQIRFKIVRQPYWSPRKVIKRSCTQWDNPTVLRWCSVRVTGQYRWHKLFKLAAWITSASSVSATSWKASVSYAAQEAEGLRKSLQNSDAYFLVQQQALEDLSAKQEKVNKLAKHLASIVGTQDIVSWDLLKWFQFLICFAAAFICAGRQLWQPVYMICCFVPYICTGGELWCPVDVICVIAVIA